MLIASTFLFIFVPYKRHVLFFLDLNFFVLNTAFFKWCFLFVFFHVSGTKKIIANIFHE